MIESVTPITENDAPINERATPITERVASIIKKTATLREWLRKTLKKLAADLHAYVHMVVVKSKSPPFITKLNLRLRCVRASIITYKIRDGTGRGPPAYPARA